MRTHQKPLRIGITGGIGSGKTLICTIFKILGAPVFDADREAKLLMQNDKGLVNSLKAEFGNDIFDDSGNLQRQILAERVFSNPQQLATLNKLVHPVVIRAGHEWSDRQRVPYTIKEAALLFESGSYTDNDFNVLVTAPEELRIQRTMQRDSVSREQVVARIRNQWPEEDKRRLADFMIINDGHHALLPQLLNLHERFKQIANDRNSE